MSAFVSRTHPANVLALTTSKFNPPNNSTVKDDETSVSKIIPGCADADEQGTTETCIRLKRP